MKQNPSNVNDSWESYRKAVVGSGVPTATAQRKRRESIRVQDGRMGFSGREKMLDSGLSLERSENPDLSCMLDKSRKRQDIKKLLGFEKRVEFNFGGAMTTSPSTGSEILARGVRTRIFNIPLILVSGAPISL